MTKKYLSNLFKTYQKGDAREESYYKHLADFITEFSESQRKKKIDVTILPKKTEAGNPDFRIWDGKQKIIGYIEAKDLGVDLDRIEDTEQLKRYLSTFPNVILTNYTEFRLFRNGERIEKISITRPFVIKKLSTVPPLENEDKLFELFEKFLDFSLPKTYTAKTLAVELAKRTKFLKDEIVSEELKSGTKSIQGFYEAFKEFLIAGISEEEFADLYSQTITYGLFAARLRAEKDFNRKLAYSFIPKSIGILRDIFKFISLDELPPQMEIIIDDIADVLSAADAKKILDHYYHEGKGSDPVLHFYETFLSVYDPATREKRGVYYTPEPVVSFIVRSLHQILKDKFNISDGLAAKDVTLLDPAGGTLSFLAKAIEIAVEEFENKYGKGAVKTFLKDQVLQNYYSFELMMAPYAIGHMKMSFLLEELGYRMEDDERVKYYLTNTLDMKELDETKFPGMSSLSTESHEAGKVKKQVPILVVLGNPPYSGISSNKGEWISEQIESYKYVDGKHFGERKHWLQDDYVKFIRFSQWKIDQAGEGVLGFITNHSYLDNPTFRGMRQSLMNSFDEIYILDLHGNSLKKEKAFDGSKDENVFDIQQGVAIAFFIKHMKIKIKSVFHHELLGLRDAKYDWLNKHNIKNVKWNKLEPNSPYYFLVQRDEKYSSDYYNYFSIQDIFPINVTGIVTARDSFVIDIEKDVLKRRIEEFRSLLIHDASIKERYKLKDSRGWKFQAARKELAKDENWSLYFSKILYRPFDVRNIYYTEKMVDWGRQEVMRHMLEENISLCFMRQVSTSESYSQVLVSQQMVDNRTFFSSKGIIQQAPLYLYSERKEKRKNPLIQIMMFEPEVKYQTRQPNIKPELFAELKNYFKKEPTPEEIFYYIYAVLYSNTYRVKYAQFLKIDFPRVPFTKDYKVFIQLGKLGKKLADLHLLKAKELENVISKFPVAGSYKVIRPKYEDEKVWINKEQFFNNVKEEVWKYQVGGYQVCEKWLKDRQGRTLTVEEIQTYCKIVTALSKTIELQSEIDKYFENVEKTV
ncbi:MAG: N-6 DNA methylase [Ignavibacteriaceae bacterium]|nr:N-6 DNA methylase [Ignavibacteriaceae bacterium]